MEPTIKRSEGNAGIRRWHVESQSFVCIKDKEAGSVRVVAGVRLGVVQLAGVDPQMTRITSRMGRARAIETSEVTRHWVAMGTTDVLVNILRDSARFVCTGLVS